MIHVGCKRQLNGPGSRVGYPLPVSSFCFLCIKYLGWGRWFCPLPRSIFSSFFPLSLFLAPLSADPRGSGIRYLSNK